MSKYAVHQYGTDTSGRTIWMTAYMAAWWERVVAELGFRPTIVQGAFMTRDGGGAAASEGYHDQGGCIDIRVRDLTASQVDQLVRTCRQLGAAAWRRDKTPAHGGMDPHCHITLGSDRPLSAGARASWQSYLDGHDGLAGNRPDYEWRPKPLITTPPKEDDMPLNDADKKWLQQTIREEVRATTGDVVKDDNAKGGRIWSAHALSELLDLTRKIAKKVGA